MVLISACLMGLNCKYNGGNNYHEKAVELVQKGEAIPICPEQLGGLCTPRHPAEIRILDNEKYVINQEGEDVTDAFERGAEEVLKLAKELHITKAILKSKSPSCGKGKIYDGSFTGNLVEGNGVTAELLIKNGIEVQTLEEWLQEIG